MENKTNTKTDTKRIVISKSAKRKMSSPENPNKANTFTEMVVYHSKNGKGKKTSVTKHEVRRNA